ncbi:MAG: NYN domain-containing protein [Candidatus Nanopelagicales bacterium]|jgi:uncharacterized LabA/DUF88 family protein
MKVAIFIDYQNLYKEAERKFKRNNISHIDPSKLSKVIVNKLPFDYQLDQIRIYTGIPNINFDKESYLKTIQRFNKWSIDKKVIINSRTLIYPKYYDNKNNSNIKPREKGIDVLLAIDLVILSFQKQFDAIVLFSLDTDLKPALEFVLNLNPPLKVFVSAWKVDKSPNKRLHIKNSHIPCIWLNENDFKQSLLS